MARVSVIMPAYNASKYIEQSINSVINQTYIDYELIIVDDCSSDGTFELINNIQRNNEKIVIYKNDRNMGAAATRMFAISKAKGEWIAFLDSDDLWEETKLEKQMQLIDMHNDIDISYTASAYINEAGERYSYILHAVPRVSYHELLFGNIMSCSSVVVRKELIVRVGMARDDMHEDFAAWLMILREGRVAYGIDEPLLIYRLMTNSKSSGRVRSAKMVYNTYRYVGYNRLVACFYVFRYFFYSVRKRGKIKRSERIINENSIY